MSLKKYLKQKRRIYDALRWLKASNAPEKIAAYCLFHLNRHIRGLEKGLTKTTVYNLKNELVRWLYLNGYCISTGQESTNPGLLAYLGL